MSTQVLLSNLNADASTIRAAMEPMTQSSSYALIIALVIILGLGLFLSSLFSKSKSKEYRTLLSDMFVAGKVRKIADEEEIDLEVEYSRFKKWEKKSRMIGSDIDKTVEVNLRDKITEVSEIEIDNLGKSKSSKAE